MYARQPPDPRFPRNFHIPHNYSGNAFSPKSEPPPPPEPEPLAAEETESPLPETAPTGTVSTSPLASLFHRSLGAEELLLLGVLFLVSQNDEKDDLLFLLILLLLIG